MNEGGNASLIEISIAAMIMLGSMGLVATMEPEVQALAPVDDNNGYAQSLLDAFLLGGGDVDGLVDDLWQDGDAATWFDQFESEYAVYLNTGHARIPLTVNEFQGATGRTFLTDQVTIRDNILSFSVEDVFQPGDGFYENQGLEYLTGPMFETNDLLSVEHYGPDGISSTTFTSGKHGTDWRDHWNDAFNERRVPTEIPYGVWRADVQTWIVYPVLPGPIQSYYWYVLAHDDTDIDHFATYELELVLP